MTLTEQFNAAAEKSKQMTQRPANDELLELYALFKQGSEGDVSGERPGGFDFKAAAKYHAWDSKKGTSQEDAMQAYIQLVDRLFEKYK